MPISDDFLRDLHERIDIESVISPYVTLRRKGKLLGGLCPFHNEKTPSFYVYPETQSYYCFGCGKGGDAIVFIRDIENIDYMEAVRLLCERYGISMPEDNFDNGLSKKRMRMLEANREAARFFYKQMFEPHGKIARDYCNQRQLTRQTVTNFGIGFAPDSWTALKDYLNKKGFSDTELFEADLIKKSSKGTYFDTFRNRLVFPIIDLRGNVLGFSGRRLNEEDRAKYVNTADTLVYKKGKEIFGLNFAKKTQKDKLILCEGNIDVVMLHQAGFDNAVAALGTALTDEQAHVLSRYTGEILLCYDNDEAGSKAVQKALSIFSRTSIHTKVITMSGGKDPDEIIKKYGAARFQALIDGAKNDVEYKLSGEMHKHDLLTSDGKVQFVKAASRILAELTNSVEVEVYASKLAEDLSVSREALLTEIQKSRRSVKKKEQKERFRDVQRSLDDPKELMNRINPDRRNNLHVAKAEETLIASLISNPAFYKQLRERINVDDFVTSFNRRLYGSICERLDTGRGIDITSLSADFTGDELSAVAAITAKTGFISNSIEECFDCIDVIKSDGAVNSKNPSEMDDEDFLKIFKDGTKKED